MGPNGGDFDGEEACTQLLLKLRGAFPQGQGHSRRCSSLPPGSRAPSSPCCAGHGLEVEQTRSDLVECVEMGQRLLMQVAELQAERDSIQSAYESERKAWEAVLRQLQQEHRDLCGRVVSEHRQQAALQADILLLAEAVQQKRLQNTSGGDDEEPDYGTRSPG
eukprot:RCo037511